jgi:hypothetical protein
VSMEVGEGREDKKVAGADILIHSEDFSRKR